MQRVVYVFVFTKTATKRRKKQWQRHRISERLVRFERVTVRPLS